jgi:hypothetical protein
MRHNMMRTLVAGAVIALFLLATAQRADSAQSDMVATVAPRRLMQHRSNGGAHMRQHIVLILHFSYDYAAFRQPIGHLTRSHPHS